MSQDMEFCLVQLSTLVEDVRLKLHRALDASTSYELFLYWSEVVMLLFQAQDIMKRTEFGSSPLAGTVENALYFLSRYRFDQMPRGPVKGNTLEFYSFLDTLNEQLTKAWEATKSFDWLRNLQDLRDLQQLSQMEDYSQPLRKTLLDTEE